MPRSVVIYTDAATLSGLRDLARKGYADELTKPYTFSYGHKTEGTHVRARICELREGVLRPAIDGLAKKGTAVLAAPQDRDVRSLTYEELAEEADRRATVATLQFATPVILEISGEIVPFPFIPAIFKRYVETWKTFSNVDISRGAETLRHIHIIDFKISCVSTFYGPGSQGWVRLEMERGRCEEEISLFNRLMDFAFFCGSGLHTDEGLGQTRRMEHREGRAACVKRDGRIDGGALY